MCFQDTANNQEERREKDLHDQNDGGQILKRAKMIFLLMFFALRGFNIFRGVCRYLGWEC